jgi:hypothetical protein
MALFDSSGFQWDRTSVPREVPRASGERAIFRFRRMLPEYVWDAGLLGGNPFPEVKTFLVEGVTVSGASFPIRNRFSVEQDVLNSFEHAMAFYLFGALQQFFFDGTGARPAS